MAVHRRGMRENTVRRERACLVGVLLGVGALWAAGYGVTIWRLRVLAPAAGAGAVDPTSVRFTDARQQAAEFIAHDRTIVLTAEQKEVMDEALATIPAPCCAKYSIATCCCPCNLAKSAWGLAKLLITRHHATAPEVKSAALEWLQFTNPGGYAGAACFTGGCERPFDRDGCGGMRESHIS